MIASDFKQGAGMWNLDTHALWLCMYDYHDTIRSNKSFELFIRTSIVYIVDCDSITSALPSASAPPPSS
jgi:hypothetical protein